MILPYELPHECETAEISVILGCLTLRQCRVLRSYVSQVELGEMSVKEWLASKTAPARSKWYGSHGPYRGNAVFLQALAAYKLAALRWQINQDRRAFEQKVACQMRGLYRPPQYG